MDTTMDIRLNELILLQTDIEPKRLQPSSSFSSPSRVFSVQCHVPIKHENRSATSSDTPPLLPRSRAASHEGNEDHQCAIPISNAAITTTSNKAFSSADRKEKEASSEMSSSDTDEDGKKSTKINEDGTIRVPSGSGYRVMTPFPWRLHEILEEVEQMKLDWIVSWLPNGRGFQVHCQNNFSEIIIPMFFRHCRYKSFQRQLYLYGFRSLDAQTMTRGMRYWKRYCECLACFCPRFDSQLCIDFTISCRSVLSSQVCEK
jgi:HSF-type DNA-binding